MCGFFWVRSIAEIAAEHSVASSLVSKWKPELLSNACQAFGNKQKPPEEVEHKRIRRLMNKLGIRGILPRRNISKADKVHYKYLYGLKNLLVTKANQAWCSDIAYIKLPQGFVYLVAIVENKSNNWVMAGSYLMAL